MSWQVFYTPHTDDESIAMGGAIARAQLAGDSTLVVLVTNNLPSAFMTRVFGHRDDLSQQRRIEWIAAMERLGVTETRTWEIEEAMIPAMPFGVQAEIERRMLALIEELHPVHHHTVWGMVDIHMEVGSGSLSHAICASALARISLYRAIGATLYGVYVYSYPEAERRAPHVVPLTEEEMRMKCRALACYRRDETDSDSIGFGYRSVPELIDAASIDPREFTMELSCG